MDASAIFDPSRDARERVDAANVLAASRDVPAELVPALVRALEDSSAWEEEWNDWNGARVGGEWHTLAAAVIDVLLHVGPPALPCILEAARAGAAGARQAAVVFANALGPDALAALAEELRGGLRAMVEAAEGAYGRANAREALAWADREREERAPRWETLVRRLSHPAPEVQRASIQELARDPDRPRTAHALVRRLTGAEPPLAFEAVGAAHEALAAIGPVLEPGDVRDLVTLIRKTSVPDPVLVRAVASHGLHAAELAPTMIPWLERQEGLALAAADCLPALLGPATSVEDPRITIFLLPGEGPHAIAVRAAGGAEHVAPLVLERLREQIRCDDLARRLEAASRLRDLGPNASPLLPDLLGLLDDDFLAATPGGERWKVVSHATRAIGELGAEALPAIPRLVALLQKDQDLRFWAVMALDSLRTLARDAEPALAALVERTRAGGRVDADAMRALERIRRDLREGESAAGGVTVPGSSASGSRSGSSRDLG